MGHKNHIAAPRGATAARKPRLTGWTNHPPFAPPSAPSGSYAGTLWNTCWVVSGEGATPEELLCALEASSDSLSQTGVTAVELVGAIKKLLAAGTAKTSIRIIGEGLTRLDVHRILRLS